MYVYVLLVERQEDPKSISLMALLLGCSSNYENMISSKNARVNENEKWPSYGG